MATFDSHTKSKFWSDRNLIKPNEVALNSHKKFWFDCECGHQFESCLLNINQSNNWCGFCSNPPKKLCDNINKITNENRVQNIYMCKNDEYKDFDII